MFFQVIVLRVLDCLLASSYHWGLVSATECWLVKGMEHELAMLLERKLRTDGSLVTMMGYTSVKRWVFLKDDSSVNRKDSMWAILLVTWMGYTLVRR